MAAAGAGRAVPVRSGVDGDEAALGLAVDGAERERLLDIAAGCGDTDVEFTPAP